MKRFRGSEMMVFNHFSVMFNGGRIVNPDEVGNMIRLGNEAKERRFPSDSNQQRCFIAILRCPSGTGCKWTKRIVSPLYKWVVYVM